MRVEERVANLLKKKGLTLAVAESCTGGYLGYLITNVPGSSAYFKGGIVSYSNGLKQRLLSVSEEILESSGAVSPEVAKLMAEGARKRGEADLGLSITGIAGPAGGTKKKPVGLVYIALATGRETECRPFHFSGDRRAIRAKSARKALSILRDYLKDKKR